MAMAASMQASAKLTVSIKRRLANGDEVFLAPGVEMSCDATDLDATQESVTERVNTWLETLLEQYPDVSTEPEEDEEEDLDEAEEDEAEEEDEEEAGDEIEVSEEEVAKMKLTDLKKLVAEAGLDLDPKGMKVNELREAVIEALFGEEEDAAEDEEAEEDEDEEAEGDADEEELTEEDLRGMKLKELQELCEEWGIEEPDVPKGTSLGDKKELYIEHILENAE